VKNEQKHDLRTVYFVIAFLLAFIGLVTIATRNISATYYNDKTTTETWSSCKTDAVCGEATGTKTQTKTVTCEKKFGHHDDECKIDTRSCTVWEGPWWNRECTKSVTVTTKDESCVPELPACQEDPTPTPIQPTPEPTSVPQPLSEAQAGPAPSCSDPEPVVQPWNCNLYRHGTSADLFWVPGDSAIVDVLYRENWVTDFVHSKPEIPNIGRATIENLVKGVPYTFAVLGRNKCSGGKTVSCVIIDDPLGFFRTTSYYAW